MIPGLPGVLRGAWWVLLAWENVSWKQSVGRGEKGKPWLKIAIFERKG